MSCPDHPSGSCLSLTSVQLVTALSRQLPLIVVVDPDAGGALLGGDGSMGAGELAALLDHLAGELRAGRSPLSPRGLS